MPAVPVAVRAPYVSCEKAGKTSWRKQSRQAVKIIVNSWLHPRSRGRSVSSIRHPLPLILVVVTCRCSLVQPCSHGANYNGSVFWSSLFHMCWSSRIRPSQAISLVRYQRRSGQWASISRGSLWNFLRNFICDYRFGGLVALGDSGRILRLGMRLQSVQLFQWRRSANAWAIGRRKAPEPTGRRRLTNFVMKPRKEGKNSDLQDL